MTSTTTMMMSSPALSWAASPTSSIVTSSGERTQKREHSQQSVGEDAAIHRPTYSENLQGKIKESSRVTREQRG